LPRLDGHQFQRPRSATVGAGLGEGVAVFVGCAFIGVEEVTDVIADGLGDPETGEAC
jgi:hypothetical protein